MQSERKENRGERKTVSCFFYFGVCPLYSFSLFFSPPSLSVLCARWLVSTRIPMGEETFVLCGVVVIKRGEGDEGKVWTEAPPLAARRQLNCGRCCRCCCCYCCSALWAASRRERVVGLTCYLRLPPYLSWNFIKLLNHLFSKMWVLSQRKCFLVGANEIKKNINKSLFFIIQINYPQVRWYASKTIMFFICTWSKNKSN